MDSKEKILLVTGSNKGIGYAIFEGLLKEKSKLKMILTSRNEQLGKSAFNKLISQYPGSKNQLYYHQLDISKEKSRKEIYKWIKQTFGKIDYLCNNAGLYNAIMQDYITIQKKM